jgi:hypothetical protein
VIENFVALLLCRSVLLRTLRSNSQSAVLVWIPSLEFPRAHQFHLLTRDRSGGTLKYKRTRAEQKQLLKEQGCEFFKDSGRKHRYVGIYGDRRMKRILRRALRWDVLPHPKRQQVSDVTVEVPLLIPSSRPQENVHPSA